MKLFGPNQSIVDLDQALFAPGFRHTLPGPFRMIVKGFSRYHTTVLSLPLLENIRLVVTADFIAESFRPGLCVSAA